MINRFQDGAGIGSAVDGDSRPGGSKRHPPVKPPPEPEKKQPPIRPPARDPQPQPIKDPPVPPPPGKDPDGEPTPIGDPPDKSDQPVRMYFRSVALTSQELLDTDERGRGSVQAEADNTEFFIPWGTMTERKIL